MRSSLPLASTLSLLLVGAACSTNGSGGGGDGGTVLDSGVRADTNGSSIDTGASVVDDTGAPGGDDAGTCTDCVTAHCSSEYLACTGEMACRAAVSCSNGCATGSGHASCLNACIASAGGSTTTINAFVGCIQANCKAPCGF